MANQILAGAVVQASQVIAGIDANNPPYVGPPPRIVANRQFVYNTDPGDNTVYTMAMDGTDLQTLPFPDGLVQNRNGDYARNIATDGNMLVVADEDYDTVYVYDMSTGAEPTSFSVPELSSNRHSVFLSSGRLFLRTNYLSPLTIYDIVTGTKVGEYDTSDNTGFHQLFVDGGKVVTIPFDENYPVQRYMYIYDIGDNDGSSEIKVALPVLSNGYRTNVSVAIGNGKIVFGDEEENAIFYIYDTNGQNRIDVDASDVSLNSSTWGSNFSFSGTKVAHASSAIGNGKIVVNTFLNGVFLVFDDDGTNPYAIDMTQIYSNSDKYNGMAGVNSSRISIANGKLIIPAINARSDNSHNESEGIVYVFDLENSGALFAEIPSPVLGSSVYFGYDHATYFTAATSLSVSGIESAYTLLSGGTNIYATSTVGGVTWSYEEPGLDTFDYLAVSSPNDDDEGYDTGAVYLYNSSDLNASPMKLVSSIISDAGRLGETDIQFTSDKLILSARRDNAVYVYDLNDTSSAPIRLTESGTDLFGFSLDVQGDNLFVGSMWDTITKSRQGSVFVYNLNDLSAPPARMVQSDPSDHGYFGSSIETTSDKIFVGAAYATGSYGQNSAGAVYVYNTSDLSFVQKITPNDLSSGDTFGGNTEGAKSITVSGNKLIVSASSQNSSQGAVYVYDTTNLSAEPVKLIASGTGSNDQFGWSVASNSTHLVVGTPFYDITTNEGAAYIYDLSDLSADPVQVTGPTDSNALFGYSVSATENYITISSKGYGAYIYNASDLSFVQSILPDDTVVGDHFGRVVSSTTVSPSSQLNGTTVTQNDNVFTVTPGTEDASFDLTFTATDSSGSSASSTASFTFEAPEAVELIPAITDQNSFEQVFTSVYDDQAKWDTPNGPAITIRNTMATVGLHSVMAEGDIAVTQGREYVFSADIADPNGDASAKLFIQNGNTELVIGGSSIPAGYVFHSDSVTFTAETDSVTIKIKRNANVNTDYYKNLSLIG